MTPASAVFDMEKLYWLNRHHIKQGPPERIEQLAVPFFAQAGLIPSDVCLLIAQWFSKVLALLGPTANKLDGLPAMGGARAFSGLL